MTTTELWPEELEHRVKDALHQAATELPARSARVERYALNGGGYAEFLHADQTVVHSLEVLLGPSPRRSGYTVHAYFQVFDPSRPNLAFLRILERRDSDGTPTLDPHVPLYTRSLDQDVCHCLIPALNRALKPLDPTGNQRSLHVDCWHGHVSPADLPTQPHRIINLIRQARRDGQHALIWTDFHDPLADASAYLLRPIAARHDLHLLPRAATPSQLRTPLRAPDGRIIQVAGLSTAVDQGLVIAGRYISAIDETPGNHTRAGFRRVTK